MRGRAEGWLIVLATFFWLVVSWSALVRAVDGGNGQRAVDADSLRWAYVICGCVAASALAVLGSMAVGWVRERRGRAGGAGAR